VPSIWAFETFKGVFGNGPKEIGHEFYGFNVKEKWIKS
jgi:hypothetical protein